MNKQIAEKMSRDLVGQTVGGWLIREYLNHGKSAVVFLAEKCGVTAALKVFDPDIVDRYGRHVQLARIERERSLIGKAHPNLISIYNGGEDNGLLFIAMEYFPGSNLEERLLDIPPENVRTLIAQIASAAAFLEDCSFAHRDIKPANIGISTDLKSAKLLDFGVLRPLNLSNITDEGEQHFFVATLRYSPPELLFREEQQTIEAWRAITFYQLGAVIHDLLVRKPLFGDISEPYAKLVRAVEREVPQVSSSAADADLRLLAQNCLAKDPTQRLDTVKWADFSRPKITDPVESARRRIAQHRAASAQVQAAAPAGLEDLLWTQCYAMRTAIHSAVVSTIKAEGMPRYSLQNILEPNPYLLRAVFEPSASHGLGLVFCFYCRGIVLDAASELKELRICACVAHTREAVPAEPDAKVSHFSLKGALIEGDVRMNVQQRLILAYAEGLDASLKSESVFWLNIGDAL